MSSTEGLKRGMPVTDTRRTDLRACGRGTLGRVFNVTGDPVDGRGPVSFTTRYPIHRKAPELTSRTPVRHSRDRHQVIDLICPFTKGGKVGAFGGAGVGRRSSFLS
jgi:F-type H+-transporting ATPase subunit beta